MKPFNLEQALKDYAEGKQTVVTRNGRKVLSLTHHKVDNAALPVSVFLDGAVSCFPCTIGGKFCTVS